MTLWRSLLNQIMTFKWLFQIVIINLIWRCDFSLSSWLYWQLVEGRASEPVFCYLTVTGLKPLVLMSTCPWARCWTPNCSWHLVNQPPPSVYEWINYCKLLWMKASAKCYCADLILSRFIVKTKNLLKHLKHIFSIINQPMRCTEQQDYQNKNGLHINVRIWSDRVTQLF